MRARGEGPNLEFKEAFPSNARKLGQEIAAFATSGGGTILIGISDAGDLLGLADADGPQSRDNLIRRIEGICMGPLKPTITPSVKFAVEDGKIVLVISVPNGTQPIYYCQSIPYVRHLTSSRPAEPHEIVDLVRQWLSEQVGETGQQSPESLVLSQLATILADMLIVVPEIEQRAVNPWLDEIHAQFRYAAQNLRELALLDVSARMNLGERVRELARAADSVADYQHFLGRESWEGFLIELDAAQIIAERMMADFIEAPGLAARAAPQAVEALQFEMRRLEDLASRADEMVERGRRDELQHEVSQIGGEVLRLSYLGLNHVSGVDVDALRAAARELHLVETMRIYIDGGSSLQRIFDTIEDTKVRIQAAV